MLALAPLASVLLAPDPAPVVDAVGTCDRAAMTSVTKAEPHRRAAFAVAVFQDLRTLANERAQAEALPVLPKDASGRAALQAAIDAKRKQVEDARATESAWRSALDELRADFLINCSGRK